MAVLSNLEVLLDGSKANLMKVRQEPLEVLRCRCFVLLACSTVEFDPIAGVEQDRFGVREPFFDFRKGSCNLFGGKGDLFADLKWSLVVAAPDHSQLHASPRDEMGASRASCWGLLAPCGAVTTAATAATTMMNDRMFRPAVHSPLPRCEEIF